MCRACGTFWGEKRLACSVLMGKPEVKISLVRHSSRGGDIKMNPQEKNVGCGLD